MPHERTLRDRSTSWNLRISILVLCSGARVASAADALDQCRSYELHDQGLTHFTLTAEMMRDQAVLKFKTWDRFVDSLEQLSLQGLDRDKAKFNYSDTTYQDQKSKVESGMLDARAGRGESAGQKRLFECVAQALEKAVASRPKSTATAPAAPPAPGPLPEECLTSSTAYQTNTSVIRVQNQCGEALHINVCVRVKGAMDDKRMAESARTNGSTEFSFFNPDNNAFRYQLQYCRPGRTTALNNCPAQCPERPR